MSEETGTNAKLKKAADLTSPVSPKLGGAQPPAPCVNFLAASAEPSEVLTIRRGEAFFDNQGILRFVDRSIVAVRKRSCVDAGRVRRMARAVHHPDKLEEIVKERDRVRKEQAVAAREKVCYPAPAIKSMQSSSSGEEESAENDETMPEGALQMLHRESVYVDSPNYENDLPPVAICPCDVTVESG